MNKIRALAAFSPDALSSIAYAKWTICLVERWSGNIGYCRTAHLTTPDPILLLYTFAIGCTALPELIPAHWWESILHNQTAWLLKAALLYHRHNLGFQRVIIDVPYYLHD